MVAVRQVSSRPGSVQTTGDNSAASSWRGGRRPAWGRRAEPITGFAAQATDRLLAVASLAVVVVLMIAGTRGAIARTTADPAALQRVATLAVPGKPLKVFDASIVDGDVYALADRSNHGVDLFDARSDRFLGRATGFTGFAPKAGFAAAGPNGMVAVGPGQVWAGDGNSTVKIVDVRSRRVVGSIPTGGADRVDELAYDPRDHLVIAANNADKPPFVSFIATQSDRRVVGRLDLPQATDGLEQPVWNQADGLVYLAVPELDGVAAHGGIAVIDPRPRTLVRMLPVAKCLPAGLALGPDHQLLVGCSDDAIAAGFPARSLIMQLPSGKIARSFDQVGGSDEVSYDARQGRYYLAAVANPGGPVLGVIDARSERWLANLPTGPHAHSVAAGGGAGHAFVPIAAGGESAQCRSGCVAVFAARH